MLAVAQIRLIQLPISARKASLCRLDPHKDSPLRLYKLYKIVDKLKKALYKKSGYHIMYPTKEAKHYI